MLLCGHSEVAATTNNLGQILKDQGDLDGALVYAQRALEIGEKVYGLEHPEVAVFANNLGKILLGRGDLNDALAYMQRALAIGKKRGSGDALV